MKTIKQTVSFKATPHEVYETLMDSKKHSKFTGSKAKISRRVGGKFSIFADGLQGTNLHLVKDKKIIQKWQCKMDNWPKDHWSKAIFSMKKTKTGTQLKFTHSNVPDKCYKSIKEGWTKYYWNPMKKMLEK